MRWLTGALALTLTACSYDTGPDEATLAQQREAAQSSAMFKTVENHAECAGFRRAQAKLAGANTSKADFYSSAAENAEIAAIEMATKEVSKDMAMQMVNELTETQAAEWGYAIESQTNKESVLAQESTCQALAAEQKEIARRILKARYGFKKP